jgi:hypothetical protein
MGQILALSSGYTNDFYAFTNMTLALGSVCARGHEQEGASFGQESPTNKASCT